MVKINIIKMWKVLYSRCLKPEDIALNLGGKC